MKTSRIVFSSARFPEQGGSVMQRCDLSATMGNQSRCRALWLDASAVYAPDLYADYRGDGFVEHAPYRLSALHKTAAGDVVVAISPDEFDPREVWPFANGAWHHDGSWMAQFWLKPQGAYDDSSSVASTGAGCTGVGTVPIPGGLAYENFELQETFRPGRRSGSATAKRVRQRRSDLDMMPHRRPRPFVRCRPQRRTFFRVR